MVSERRSVCERARASVCMCARGLGTRGWWVRGGAHVPEVFIVSW